MDRKECNAYCREYFRAIDFHWRATEDYAGARCTLLNSLFVGLRLGAEAIEKYMKAFWLFRDLSAPVKKYRHQLTKLADRLSREDPSFPLCGQESLLERFEDHYKRRYPQERELTSFSTGELNDIDALAWPLLQDMPMPDEIKFRTIPFVGLCTDAQKQPINSSMTLWPWISVRNVAIEPHLLGLKKKADEVMALLYPGQSAQNER